LPGTSTQVPAAAADAPLVLGLHGRGDTAEHFAAVAGRFGNRLAYRFLAAPLPFKGGTVDGRMWFRSSDNPEQTRAGIEALYPMIAAHARAARPRPVAILGFSQGCMVAAHFAIAYPDLVQAVLCAGGGLKFAPPMPPPGPRPAVLFVHAADDPMVPIAGAKAAARQMDDRGFATEFLEHSDGHSIPEAEIERMRGWLERHLGLR
jgi:predicted esterase